ncbi:EamA family transporter [Foetidibacter luteolus]|uniref:EamA family transporter n=1 Tax=Foetidibacter luteolus TaxID=2608880 RepID=UPI00129AD460|nr:EamA family transporter [Foetidibacter luteolus]
MLTTERKSASQAMVIIAFATVYLVWGSTYFFIQKAVAHIPAFILGALRFITAGIILMAWCAFKGEKLWDVQMIKHAAISSFLLLFIGNGAVIWAEETLPSSLVAVLVSAAPIWFVVLDKPKWQENFTSRKTLLGLAVGFVGVILLFKERVSAALSTPGNAYQIIGLLVLVMGSMSWAGGSLYSRYKSTGSATVNTAWQMMAAGIAFIPSSFISNDWSGFKWEAVTLESWLSVAYLVTMGSLAGYSAYVWLLQVRPATQVSTYAYVNPVVAVLLGVFIAGEHMSPLQIAGLAVILTSVLLINMAKHSKEKQQKEAIPRLNTKGKAIAV